LGRFFLFSIPFNKNSLLSNIFSLYCIFVNNYVVFNLTDNNYLVKWFFSQYYLKDKSGLPKTVKMYNLELNPKEKRGSKLCLHNCTKTLRMVRLNH
jgi:hypothetical protein